MRLRWCPRPESNQRHEDFQSSAGRYTQLPLVQWFTSEANAFRGFTGAQLRTAKCCRNCLWLRFVSSRCTKTARTQQGRTATRCHLFDHGPMHRWDSSICQVGTSPRACRALHRRVGYPRNPRSSMTRGHVSKFKVEAPKPSSSTMHRQELSVELHRPCARREPHPRAVGQCTQSNQPDLPLGRVGR
jgi:hypothetical protein